MRWFVVLSSALCALMLLYAALYSVFWPRRHGAGLNLPGVISFTHATLLPLQNRSVIPYPLLFTKSASLSRSSYRNKHLPAATTTNGSTAAMLVQDAGIEHTRPSELLK